ncbi:MAG: hypothetical protein AB7E49_04890 [Campylobacterales bacterium]
MKIFVLCLIVLTLAFPQNSENKKRFNEAPINTFVFIGNGLVCKTNLSGDSVYDCYRFGKFRIGDSFSIIQNHFGNSRQIINQDGGINHHVYHFPTDGNISAYWVFTEKEGLIDAIQLTGNARHPNLNFAGVMLGDSEGRVLELLGPKRKVSTVPDVNATLWDYSPFQISLEFINGFVYSIRISSYQ